MKEIYRKDNPCCRWCAGACDTGEQPDSAGFPWLAQCTVRREAEGAIAGAQFQEGGFHPVGENSDEEKDH